jgi:hypothetical protein
MKALRRIVIILSIIGFFYLWHLPEGVEPTFLRWVGRTACALTALGLSYWGDVREFKKKHGTPSSE